MVLKLLKNKTFQKCYYITSDVLVYFRSKLGYLHSFESKDEISRFAFKSEHLNKSDQQNIKIHWKCFKPQRVPSKEISVYHTTNLDQPKVKEIGQKYVADFAGKTLLGRAVFEYDSFEKVFSDNKCFLKHYPYPHKRHANILGSFEKSGQLLEYVKLESISRYDKLD